MNNFKIVINIVKELPRKIISNLYKIIIISFEAINKVLNGQKYSKLTSRLQLIN